MPRGDGTGPGWAAGVWTCRRGRHGMGFGGWGFGPGMGRRPAPYAGQNAAEDAAGLKAYADQLASELDAVRKRIAELQKGK